MGVENRANVVVDTMARERSPAREYSHAKTMLAWLALFLFAETAPWSMAARADIASIRTLTGERDLAVGIVARQPSKSHHQIAPNKV